MTTTRRDLLRFAGGAAFGAFLTPAPWRLITDTALWSENWPGIPRPARGEIRTKFTHCSLCPAGCAVRARCVGQQPVALAGVFGGLCPFGVTAHHLPYHPARLRQGPVKEAAAAVAAAIAKCGPRERVAVLDLRPGRTASWTYRRAMAGVRNGTYIAPAQPPVSVNLANARTVLSLGAPLLDGWCSPANAFAARDRFRLIQAEPVESRTASLADTWLPIRTGSEQALALSLAGALDTRDAAERTGLAERQIVDLARELKENGPALVIDCRMSQNVVALNVDLGSWGRTIVPRPEAPVPAAWKTAAPPAELAAVPDGSIRVLLIDESAPGEYLPWNEIQKKLVSGNPLVVAFACSREGYGQHAQFVLPAAAFPEVTDDLPAAVDAVAPGFRLATPLIPAPDGLVNPVDFVAGVAGLAAPDALRQRADAIHASGKGKLVTYADGKSAAVKEVKADEFWKALNAGACWTGDAAQPGRAPGRDFSPAAEAAVPALTAVAAELAIADSPLMSKVYQESNLRLGPDRVAMHPRSARECGVEDGAKATLETSAGQRRVEVMIDSGICPGVVLVAARPGFEPGQAKVVRI